MELSPSILQNFWQRVNRGPADVCWPWTGSTKTNGYARLADRSSNKMVWHRANRLSWTIHNGPIPEGLHVLHECDNRRCVNPHHLFLGSHQDNMQDRNDKGRQAKGSKIKTSHHLVHEVGESHPMSRFTNEQVLEALNRSKLPNANYSQIARELGMTRSTVSKIANGKAWKHLTN